MRSYLVIVGARPNFIKLAPLLKRSSDYPDIDFTLVHTGQHFDKNMSQVFFEQMGIRKPDIQLSVTGEFHTEKLGKMFSSIKKIVSSRSYDGVIVFGDINSTLAGAVAASSTSTKLIHIESGLRSHDRRMPEEINRAITDHLSDLLFVSEQSGYDNLVLEGVAKDKIVIVGNIMIESIEIFKSSFNESNILNSLDLEERKYVVATIHRAENTDEPHILEKILRVLDDVSSVYKVVFPLHPGTRKKIQEYGLKEYLKKLNVIEPVGYVDFMKLIMSSGGVITDSGGIQEETTYLNVPCCTLRDNTERPITVSHGTNTLFPIEDLDSKKILGCLKEKKKLANAIPFWDNQVSDRILKCL